MSKAYVVIVPSLSEAFGLVNIEAMSVGTPVIASNVGGISEVIRDGIDGFLVPPNEPKILADKICYIFQNPELRGEMGRNARLRFLNNFDQDQAVDNISEWFKSITLKS